MKYVTLSILVLFLTSCIERYTGTIPLDSSYSWERKKQNEEYNKFLKEIKYLTQAIKTEPKNGKLRYYRGVKYLAIFNGRSAYNDLKIATSLIPNNANYNCALGLSYVLLKNKKMAVKYLNIGRNFKNNNDIDICKLLSERIK